MSKVENTYINRKLREFRAIFVYNILYPNYPPTKPLPGLGAIYMLLLCQDNILPRSEFEGLGSFHSHLLAA